MLVSDVINVKIENSLNYRIITHHLMNYTTKILYASSLTVILRTAQSNL